jgi:hypothetical protein
MIKGIFYGWLSYDLSVTTPGNSQARAKRG